MQANTLKRTAVALAIAGAFAAGTVIADRAATIKPAGAATQAATVPTLAPDAVPALPDFSVLVEKYGPAVVQISVMHEARKVAARRLPGMPDDDDDSELPLPFRGFRIPQPPSQGPMQGMGSGFIVDANGVILTNAHVVDGADEVTVRLVDKREFKAKVLGTDKTTDIAVLKIQADALPVVKIGNPTTTRVGEWVVAIGAPFGLENTVTSGIVSAKSRMLPGDAAVPFIQTDAAVNPGNSGGPLFNLRGEVIGVNSQIFSRSGGFQGLAFAVPIDVAIDVKDQIQHTGKVSHGRLGVAIQDVSQPLAESFGLKSPAGALVGSVAKDGAAAKAGIAPGDVILKFEGKDISRSSELPPLVAQLKPGTKVTLGIWHDGKMKEVAVTIGELSDKTSPVASARGDATKGKLGVAVRPLSPEEMKSVDVANGVVVEDVGGAAARAGVRQGDVIVAVNNVPVKSPEQLRELVGKAGKTVALLVQREDTRIFIPVTIG
jgi:serine protease Do